MIDGKIRNMTWFNKVLLFEERPEVLSKSVFNEVRDEFSKRLHTTEDVSWHTFPKFSKELVIMEQSLKKRKR